MGSRLTMNPFADLHVHPPPEELPVDPDSIEVITVKCPVRGRGLLVRDLTREEDPDLFGFFIGLIEAGGELELDASSPVTPALAAIGFLVPEDQIFDWPRFSVPLPTGDPANGAGDWLVSPDLRFQPRFELHPDGEWPADYGDQAGLLRCFDDGPALWVGDRISLLSPFWLEADAADRVSELVPGSPAPPLPDDLRAGLVSVGALVPRGARAEPLDRFAALRDDFAAHGHAIARSLLHPAELAALRRYYRALLDRGLVRLGDRQNDRRYSSYNDPVGRFVHARLGPVMAAATGLAVDPTFSYFFSYTGGADLARHTDREQAELSISLQLDYEPSPGEGPTGWPLRFEEEGAEVAADLAIGDAVLYHGRELVHFRSALPESHRSSHLVLEYVPEEFDGLRA